jgi:hypothetical protein
MVAWLPTFSHWSKFFFASRVGSAFAIPTFWNPNPLAFDLIDSESEFLIIEFRELKLPHHTKIGM